MEDFETSPSGVKDEKGTDEETTALINEICERIRDLRDSSGKCLDSISVLSQQANMNTEVCSRLAEKVYSMEDDNNTEITQTKKQETNSKKAHPQNSKSIISELFTDISMFNIGGGKEGKLHEILWIFIHTVALLISGTYIHDAYLTWQNAPIVQSLVTTNAKEIPLPATTICNRVSLDEEYDREEILDRCISNETSQWWCSDEELKLLLVSMDIQHLENVAPTTLNKRYSSGRFKPAFDYVNRILPEVWNRTYISGADYLKYIEKLSVDCFYLKIYNTDIDGRKYRIVSSCNTSMFVALLPTESHSGIYKCLTLNSVTHGPREIRQKNVYNEFLKHHYTNSSTCDPDSIIGTVCNADLLYTDKNFEIEVLNIGLDRVPFFMEYKVFLHHPFDYPSSTHMQGYSAFKRTDTIHAVQPVVIDARKDLLLVDVSRRGCIFSFEKSLSLFKYYTYHNCILECQINCSLTLCGCIPYTMAIFNSSFNVCSSSKSDECNLISDFFVSKKFKDDRCGCNCPLDCISLSYDSEETTYVNEGKTWCRIVYKELVFLSNLRYSVTSTTEFVAYSLGILGVFNGFMIMEFEILYWLTLHLWSNINRLNTGELEGGDQLKP